MRINGVKIFQEKRPSLVPQVSIANRLKATVQHVNQSDLYLAQNIYQFAIPIAMLGRETHTQCTKHITFAETF